MRFLFPSVICLVTLVGVVAHVRAQNGEPVSTASPGLKITQKLNPRVVELLKTQADLRKEFYNNEAKAKNDIKLQQKREERELLERHRAARAEFSKQTHSADERATFYRGQRDEMATLKARHAEERKQLFKELKVKFTDFHRSQRQARQKLEDDLQKTK